MRVNMSNYSTSDNSQVEDQDCGPWYTHLWVWFIIAPLIAVVAASSVLVYMAVVHGDDVVQDNYYKEGRLINQRLVQDEHALLINVHGRTEFDLESGEVFLTLNSDKALPQELLLLLNHPTSENFDHEIRLQMIGDNRYRGDLEMSLSYRWYLRLLPVMDAEQQNTADWRLLAEIDFRNQQGVDLLPRH